MVTNSYRYSQRRSKVRNIHPWVACNCRHTIHTLYSVNNYNFLKPIPQTWVPVTPTSHIPQMNSFKLYIAIFPHSATTRLNRDQYISHLDRFKRIIYIHIMQNTRIMMFILLIIIFFSLCWEISYDFEGMRTLNDNGINSLPNVDIHNAPMANVLSPRVEYSTQRPHGIQMDCYRQPCQPYLHWIPEIIKQTGVLERNRTQYVCHMD